MEITSLHTPNNKLSIIRFIFESVWNVFLPYLSNLEIGKLDLILTDVSLRKLYISLVNEFYLKNKVYNYKELDWILTKNIALTKCHLDFKLKGMTLFCILVYYMRVIFLFLCSY